jgi:hypothetical protein
VTTCVVHCTIGAPKVDAFERFAAAWTDRLDRHDGTHHGWHLPDEGASDEAPALFGLPSLADHEIHRQHVDDGQRVPPGRPHPRRVGPRAAPRVHRRTPAAPTARHMITSRGRW